MKTPLRFLKTTALAAIFAASAVTAGAGDKSRVSWFDENISSYQSFSSAVDGVWSGDTTSCSVEDNAITVDTDTELIYSPTDSSDDQTVVSTVSLTFPSGTTSLPSAPGENPQTAFTVATNGNGVAKYWVYGKETAGASAAWIEGSAATVGEAVTVTITIDYAAQGGATATYSIGGTTVATAFLANTPSSACVSSFAFAGNGTVSSLFTGKYGSADFVVGQKAYASYAAALEAALAAGTSVSGWDATASDGQGGTGAYDNTYAAGTSANPYLIPTLDALKVFQAAVANSNGLTSCYRQTADIALDAAWPGIGLQNGKDDYDKAVFDDAAFKGTYDGGNYTISEFQMVGGNLDYCGFFNSVSNATIQNLKIQYAGSTLAADTTSSTTESGATFVGVAKGATLRNLTALPKDNNTGVSAGKGIGGIVGYLTCGSTVDSCTNRVALTSHTNKAGGIAMIRQNGDSSTICNCLNTGMVSTSATGDKASQFGGIVGYVDHDLVISNCENTAACKVLHNNTGVITMQGVNKGNATVASYTYASGHPVDGLNFATVDGNVATFVADNALALNGEYKVMAAGATATFNFTEAGTIAFDTALATPTYAITAANGLDLTDATSGTVKTYTAAAHKYPAVFLR